MVKQKNRQKKVFHIFANVYTIKTLNTSIAQVLTPLSETV